MKKKVRDYHKIKVIYLINDIHIEHFGTTFRRLKLFCKAIHNDYKSSNIRKVKKKHYRRKRAKNPKYLIIKK